MAINTVALVGRITKDIEPKSTTSGKEVCNFTLAVDGFSKESPANFISCVAWNGLVGVLTKYAGKGKQVAVTGRLQTQSYEDKEGNKRSKTEVVVDQLQLLGGGEKKDGNASNDDGEPVDPSEIPF